MSTKFVAACCNGEVCRCGMVASHKLEETIFRDDPNPARHPLTNYVCDKCFASIMLHEKAPDPPVVSITGQLCTRCSGWINADVSGQRCPCGGELVDSETLTYREMLRSRDTIASLKKTMAAILSAACWADRYGVHGPEKRTDMKLSSDLDRIAKLARAADSTAMLSARKANQERQSS